MCILVKPSRLGSKPVPDCFEPECTAVSCQRTYLTGSSSTAVVVPHWCSWPLRKADRTHLRCMDEVNYGPH